MSAALEIFLEKGFSATRLDDIAARAGVSKGTIYLYFESKEALFEDVIRQSIVPELNLIRERVDQHNGSAVECLRGLLSDWARVIAETPLGRTPKLVLSEVDRFPDLADAYHKEAVESSRTLLRQVLEMGIEQGEFHILDMETMVEALLATLWMPAISWESRAFRSGAAPDLVSYLEALLELIVTHLSCKAPKAAVAGPVRKKPRH